MIPALRRQREEDFPESRASLDISSSRTGRATETLPQKKKKMALALNYREVQGAAYPEEN